MSNIQTKLLRNISFAILTLLLIALSAIAFMTYRSDILIFGQNLSFAVQHHTAIMAGLLIISILFGFATSQIFYAELQRKKKVSQSILGVVLLFLSREEREIVNFLVENKGITTQAEIARLPHMNRVKAHRSLQKMSQKQIIELIAHGKIRKVHLKENILQLLMDDR